MAVYVECAGVKGDREEVEACDCQCCFSSGFFDFLVNSFNYYK